jgi:hypothetical protein
MRLSSVEVAEGMWPGLLVRLTEREVVLVVRGAQNEGPDRSCELGSVEDLDSRLGNGVFVPRTEVDAWSDR